MCCAALVVLVCDFDSVLFWILVCGGLPALFVCGFTFIGFVDWLRADGFGCFSVPGCFGCFSMHSRGRFGLVSVDVCLYLSFIGWVWAFYYVCLIVL